MHRSVKKTADMLPALFAFIAIGAPRTIRGRVHPSHVLVAIRTGMAHTTSTTKQPQLAGIHWRYTDLRATNATLPAFVVLAMICRRLTGISSGEHSRPLPGW